MSKDHEPFECPYCYGIVQAKRQRSWRKHVLADLRAYNCTFPDCSSGLFEDGESWFQHELHAHRRQWNCHSCDKKGFNSSQDLVKHLRRAHDSAALPDEVLSQVVAANSQPVAEISASDCPLCDQLEHDMRAEASRLGTEIALSSRVMLPISQFERHLGDHLEQLALFAVPPTIDGNVESHSKKGTGDLDDPEDHQVREGGSTLFRSFTSIDS